MPNAALTFIMQGLTTSTVSCDSGRLSFTADAASDNSLAKGLSAASSWAALSRSSTGGTMPRKSGSDS